MKHRFGGLWTRKKLEVLEEYLRFYLKALKKQPFTLHYADAFAGTGSQDPKVCEGQGELIPEEDLKGSVMVALDIDPGFDRYHFNDLNPAHIQSLQEMCRACPEKNIKITENDANDFVPLFCDSLNWDDRAVLFLDPYSTQLDWETLKNIADSGKVDLWLLFPLSVIIRMTPIDGAKIRPEWRDTLNRLLGTNEWEAALYKPNVLPVTDDLFEAVNKETDTERLNVEGVQLWITERLRELFPFVAKPLLLKNNGKPLFLLFFAVSNTEQKAWGLAQKAANHIIKKYGVT